MNRTLQIGNLPLSATEHDLRTKFGRCGSVESVELVTDADTGRSKRYGYVRMATDADARLAIARLNMTQYEEAVMSVSQARPAQPPPRPAIVPSPDLSAPQKPRAS